MFLWRCGAAGTCCFRLCAVRAVYHWPTLYGVVARGGGSLSSLRVFSVSQYCSAWHPVVFTINILRLSSLWVSRKESRKGRGRGLGDNCRAGVMPSAGAGF